MNPNEFPAVLAARFGRGEIEELLAGYDDAAVLNLGAGGIFRGHGEIRGALMNFLAIGAPMVTALRSATVSGDTAVVAFDWSMGPMEGRAVDVLRLGSDGVWRQLLDLPFGSA